MFSMIFDLSTKAARGMIGMCLTSDKQHNDDTLVSRKERRASQLQKKSKR
jgi:hypothetical protein